MRFARRSRACTAYPPRRPDRAVAEPVGGMNQGAVQALDVRPGESRPQDIPDRARGAPAIRQQEHHVPAGSAGDALHGGGGRQDGAPGGFAAPAAERRPHLGLEECAAELVAGVRPVRQPGDALSVERDDRRAIRRAEQAKVLVQAAEHAVAASPDGREVVHEDQVVRADLLVAGQGLHVRDAVGGRPRVTLVDLGEVRDGHRLTVDEELEVVRLETANPVPFPVRDDDFDVDDPHVDRVREQLGQRTVLSGRRQRGENQRGSNGRADFQS